MSRRTYPRVGSSRKLKGKLAKCFGERTCRNCGASIGKDDWYHLVDIEWNWMRGDDDVVPVCNTCGHKPLQVERLIKMEKQLREATDAN